MKIFVLGNINAGKSCVVEKLRRVLPNYSVLQIDIWRKQYCDGSIEKEEQAWVQFPEAVLRESDVIVELSGGGRIAQNITAGLPDRSCLVIKVCATAEQCIERIAFKDFFATPYPKYEGAESIEETILRIDGQMATGAIERLWGDKAIAVTSVSSSDDISRLPIRQYEKIVKLKSLYQRIPCEMFLFGSAGRGEMNENSDVDVFLRSDRSVEWHCDYLSAYFESTAVMGNEVVIREDGVLVELDVIREPAEAERFYRTGNIVDPEHTVLIGNAELVDTLSAFLEKTDDVAGEIKFTVERLRYYVLSLPVLQRKQDEYKYYFHNNIVVHEYVRLKAMLNGIFEYNYLPLHAKELLTEAEWDTLLFSFGDGMTEHYEKTKALTDSLIEAVKAKWNI